MSATHQTKGGRKAKETNARRKVNDHWMRIENSCRYRKAVAYNVCRDITDQITEEVLDWIFLTLNERNEEKSTSEKNRLLRRIVEKRQAQAIHTKTRKNRDRKAAVAIAINSSKCLRRIHQLRLAI